MVLGSRVIARGLANEGGLVSDLPGLEALCLVGVGELAFGGWVIAPTGLVAQACALARRDAAAA